MHDNFLALEREKRDRIINAAMREFFVKGFDNASTNEIVKKAGISKGTLFYYFSSKKMLFDFLFNYGVQFLIEALHAHAGNMPADVFDRWSAFAALKIKIATQYPEIANFVQYAVKEDVNGLNDFSRSEVYNKFTSDINKKIYDGIDLSKFKPEVDTVKALRIIWWMLEGYSLAKQKEFELINVHDTHFAENVMLEVEGYLKMLKKAFYREEFGTS